MLYEEGEDEDAHLISSVCKCHFAPTASHDARIKNGSTERRFSAVLMSALQQVVSVEH